jgi:hypothetical protein
VALSGLAAGAFETDDLAGAKSAAEKALAAEPDYWTVRTGLFPAIEKKASKKP